RYLDPHLRAETHEIAGGPLLNKSVRIDDRTAKILARVEIDRGQADADVGPDVPARQLQTKGMVIAPIQVDQINVESILLQKGIGRNHGSLHGFEPVSQEEFTKLLGQPIAHFKAGRHRSAQGTANLQVNCIHLRWAYWNLVAQMTVEVRPEEKQLHVGEKTWSSHGRIIQNGIDNRRHLGQLIARWNYV